jgi:methionine-R-sulfoxide reductase
MARYAVFGVILLAVAGGVVVMTQLSLAEDRKRQSSENTMVTVRVIREDGTLSEPVQQNKIVKSDEEWKKLLTPEQYRVVRSAGTERPFCSGFLRNKEPGMYVCVACNLPLFDSSTKFESGTGWPSFYRPAVAENVAEKQDRSHGMVRTEINCARCDGHLGHVFDDGPKPTGLRYCLNGESLKFVKNEDLKTVGEKLPTTQPAK